LLERLRKLSHFAGAKRSDKVVYQATEYWQYLMDQLRTGIREGPQHLAAIRLVATTGNQSARLKRLDHPLGGVGWLANNVTYLGG
jgi:hypothetical protein